VGPAVPAADQDQGEDEAEEGDRGPAQEGGAEALGEVVQVGGALGLAVLSSVATSHTADVTNLHDLTEGFQAAFLGGAAIAFLGFILTLVLISSKDSRAHVELGSPATESA
jgi:hypothetical protein